MSLNYVEIDLDRPRRLSYRFADLRDLCRRLGNVTLAQCLERLGGLDLDAMLMALQVGLRGEDRKLTYERTEELVQGYIEKHGSVMGLMAAITEGMEKSGVLRRPREDSQGEAAGRTE